jgi:hypothetical protein
MKERLNVKERKKKTQNQMEKKEQKRERFVFLSLSGFHLFFHLNV